MKKILLAVSLAICCCTHAQRELHFNDLGDALKEPEKVFHLSLNGHAITHLPDTLFSLYNLEALSLVNCSLSVIPDKIAKLKNLKLLQLNFNQLTSLPESLGELINLEELYLNNNRLTSLPRSLCNLTKLTTVTIDHNQLTEIPDCFQSFEHLSYFTLSDNKLTEEPKSIGLMEYRFSDTVWSSDESRAVFLATSKGLVRDNYGFYLPRYEIRLFDTELAANTILVRSRENNGKPEDMLSNFRNFFFAPDNKYVYFIVANAWEKTDALHRVNILTLKEHFVVDAFSYIVIDKGKHKGDLLVSRLFYNEGGPGASYWLISGDGKNRKALTNDEAVQLRMQD